MEEESTPSNFSFALTKTAVSQICQSTGFKSSQSSALHTLTKVTTLYIQTLAHIASSRANYCNRTESNISDLISALEDLYSVKGFNGCSNPVKPILKSTVVIDLIKFVDNTEEIPFAKPVKWDSCRSYKGVLQPVTLFRAKKRGVQLGSGKKDSIKNKEFKGVVGCGSHVPDWLPSFPPDMSMSEDIKRGCGVNNMRFVCNGEEECERGKGIKRKGKVSNVEKCEMGLMENREKVRFKMGSRKKGVNWSNGNWNGLIGEEEDEER